MDTNKSKGKIDRKIENSTTKKEDISKEESAKEKKMSSAQKALPYLIVGCITLAVILLATLIAFFQLKADDKQNSSTLEAVYASSYFTMVDGINNLQVDSSKFESLANTSLQRQSLKDMELDCQYVLSGLRVLPIEAQNCMAATKFFNQINGMCEAYINKLDKGESLTTEEVGLMSETSYVLGVIKQQFNNQNSSITRGGYSFIDASVFNSKGVNEFSNTLGSLKGESIDYPTMIFDGPFSASLEDKSVDGLSEKEITKEQAEDYVRNVVFKGFDSKVKYEDENGGDIETYSFNCEVEGAKFNAQITKREGKLLTLSGDASDKEAVMSKEESITLAEKYARQLGFENMKAVWWESTNSIVYVNLAPVINNVIFYPDLVKVKVDLGNQLILGFESKNYCLNHVDRKPSAKISESEAKSVITGDYEIKGIRLALIPREDESEVLTYELECDGIDGTYFFYVNAGNKIIEQTLKVVDQNGTNKLI